MSEIKFRRDTSFRKQFFVSDSFAHPAKMDAQLLIWIVEHYTAEGETILDPMAGSGTTMLACTLGRDVCLVELEEKFCKMMRDNWEQVKMRPQLGSAMGDCKIIQGDARQLENILCDKIITSPPFADSEHNYKHGLKILSKNFKGRKAWENKGLVDKIVTSPPHGDSNVRRGDKAFNTVGAGESMEYGYTEGQIANLPYGEIDKCIFSPPYAEVNQMPRDNPDPTADKNARANIGKQYSDNPSNIGNLKSQSYLESMLQVYQQCYKVLRDGGLMILVTKNFLREQQEIRLDTDTIALCEKAGFLFVERHFRILSSQSFWRVIYAKKYPDAPVLDKEDILVFSKQTEF